MDETERLAERFEEHRAHLRAVAYRMLGSLSDADDAVQDTWLRLSRGQVQVDKVENLGGWLATIVARVSLNMLRARHARREEALGVHVPDPILCEDRPDGSRERQPEEAAMLADSVGLALLVVLDTLTPEERLAFVLHDVFGVPFEQIGLMVERTSAAARQLASRARRRVRASAALPVAAPDLARQRAVVDAFFLAVREGDFDALVAMLDPDVVLRIDGGVKRRAPSMVLQGATAVARQAFKGIRSASLARRAVHLHPVLVNGAVGVVVSMEGQPMVVMGFTVAAGKIVEIDAIADPDRVRRITAPILSDEEP